MPTLESVTVHQLAALVAVEREAAERFRKAEVTILRAMWTHGGIDNDAYRAASAEDDAALRAISHARTAVDEALASLSYPRDGVMPQA